MLFLLFLRRGRGRTIVFLLSDEELLDRLHYLGGDILALRAVKAGGWALLLGGVTIDRLETQLEILASKSEGTERIHEGFSGGMVPPQEFVEEVLMDHASRPGMMLVLERVLHRLTSFHKVLIGCLRRALSRLSRLGFAL